MSLVVSYLEPDTMPAHMPRLRELLDTIPDCDTDDVLADCLDGARKIIVVGRMGTTEIIAVAVVQLSYIPKPMLLVHGLAGECMAEWAPLLNGVLTELAKDSGVSCLRGYGRRGFARALSELGWREVSTICELEI
jgi:hypothetical protein